MSTCVFAMLKTVRLEGGLLENVRSTSVLSKIHKMFLRFLFSQSQFDHLRYNSLTLALSQKTARKSTRSYSFIAHSLATQEFPVIVDFIYWFSLHSCQKGHVLFVSLYDNNTFPTHTPLTWFAIEAYVIIYVPITRFES